MKYRNPFFKSLVGSLCLLTLSLPTLSHSDAPSESKPIRLRFENTDLAEILHAISLKTGANIVLASTTRRNMSLNLTAATVEEALKTVTTSSGMLYRLIGRSYVVASSTEIKQLLEASGAKARFPLKYMPVEEAVRLVEATFPFLTVRPLSNQILMVGADEDLKLARVMLLEEDVPRAVEETKTEIISLKILAASQVSALLKSTYPKLKIETSGSGDKPGGAISLIGAKSLVSEARKTIERLDMPADSGGTPADYRIYNIKYSSAPVLQDFLSKAFPKLQVIVGPANYAPSTPKFNSILSATSGSSSGGSGGQGGGNGGSSGGGGGGASGGGGSNSLEELSLDAFKDRMQKRARTLLLSGSPVELEYAFKLLDQLDIAPQQVMVDVKVVDTSPERAEDLGVSWDWNPLHAIELPKGTGLDPKTGVPATSQSGPLQFGAFSRVPWEVFSTLSAMVTRKEAKVLADPRIQVIYNEDASIFIGDTLRTQVTQSSLTGTTIQVLEFPVGIILLVRPRINGDGRVTLRVHPVVSTVTSLGAGNIPQSSSREAETTVMLKDGETVVIGGLIREEHIRSLREVPLLSKLPLIGELFRSRSTSHRKSDILIFLTPRIVRDKN